MLAPANEHALRWRCDLADRQVRQWRGHWSGVNWRREYLCGPCGRNCGDDRLNSGAQGHPDFRLDFWHDAPYIAAMTKKLSDDEVTELLHAMGEMLFKPEGDKYEAETAHGQARLDAALQIALIATAGQQIKPKAGLTVVDGGKD